MSRPSLSWPVTILAGFAVLLAMLLIGSFSSGTTTAQPQQCSKGNDAYPECVTQTVAAERGFPCEKGTQTYPVCATQTAQAQTDAAQPPDDDNDGNNNGSGNSQQPSATPTVTSTATFTPTATRTTIATSPTSVTPTTARPSATSARAEEASPTPTSLLPAGVETIACVPGETVDLRGEAAPNTALLLFFDGRAVGGGYSLSDGRYRLRLQVGAERPGTYLVEIQERDSRLVVQQIGCEVPAFTPTPTSELAP